MHLLCLSGLDSPTLSFGTKQTLRSRQSMSALGDVAEVAQTTRRAHGGKFTGGSRRSISCRRGSSHAGSFSAVPSVSGRSSMPKPGGSVAISNIHSRLSDFDAPALETGSVGRNARAGSRKANG
jgi:hypothetical protein